MFGSRPRLALATVLSLTAVAASAAEPEALPRPRTTPATVVLPSEASAFPTGNYRVNRYDVWQYYGVDYQGRFRPRVIYSPSGSYYLYNGEPYPWVTTHPRDVMPRVVD